jgi:Replication-relaxation
MPRRGVAGVSSGGGGRSAAQRLAALTGRLTDRDRTLCRLLHQHRVLTTPQLTDLAFPSRNAAEHRLAILYQLGVLDRFRPRHTPGSAPYHYVLGPLGAALLAAQTDQEPAELGYRRDRTLALAHSQRLAHLLGVNSFFCALARTARQDPAAALEVWWSEQRCAARWGRLVHPDGYGRWREHQSRVDFFLEHDRGSESLGRLAAKLPGYLQLAQASQIATPLLVWLPTPTREAAARQALAASSLPVATATPDPDQTPAGPLWLPLHASGPRRRLAQLATAW